MSFKTWEFITEEAATDKGLNIRQTAQFHMFNPNGVVAQLPWKTEDFALPNRMYACGMEVLYARHHMLHVDLLRNIANGARSSRWRVTYYIGRIREKAEEFPAAMAEHRANAA